MASLPTELWALILDYVDDSDLKSCRLLNRQVYPLASVLLFSKLCITPSHNSLDRAANIARSPPLSQYTETLVYRIDALQYQPYQCRPHLGEHFPSWLYPYYSDPDYEQNYSNTDKFLASPDTPKEIIRDHGERYKLQRLLNILPNLRGIQLRCMNNAYVPRSNLEHYRWGCTSCTIDALPVTGRLILVLVLLAKNPQTSVTSIVCERLDWDFFYGILPVGVTVYPLLHRLRRLQLDLTMLVKDPEDDVSAPCPDELEQFFKATTNLEMLILDFGAYDNWDFPDGAEAIGNAIISSRKWSQLKTLSLAGLIFGHDELLNFLDLHPTLRNLRLSQICLYSGNVLSLILGLQRNAFLNNLSFHGVYDDHIFEDDCSEGTGSCIAPANVIRRFGQPASSAISCSLDEEGLKCSGYRADEWFGGDGSWCTCDGTPADESISLPLAPTDIDCPDDSVRLLPPISALFN